MIDRKVDFFDQGKSKALLNKMCMPNEKLPLDRKTVRIGEEIS